MFVSAKPKDIFTFILSKLGEKDIKVKESSTKWKMSFTMEESVVKSDKNEETKQDDLLTKDIKIHQQNECHIEVNLKKVNDKETAVEETAVEFNRIGGDPLYFHNCFN